MENNLENICSVIYRTSTPEVSGQLEWLACGLISPPLFVGDPTLPREHRFSVERLEQTAAQSTIGRIMRCGGLALALSCPGGG